MTRVTYSIASLLLATALTSVVHAQSGTLEGAWKVIAVTGADGKTDGSPQPGLYIFTDRHYSVQLVRTPRKPLPQNASEKERLDAFDPYTANTGTYDLKGTTLIRRVVAAKNPNLMAAPAPSQDELRWEGSSTVFLTTNAPGGGKTVTKLQRVE